MTVLAAMAAGCGGSSAVSLTQVAPGQQGCPTGGVLISDGNVAQVVCNGATQPTVTTLPPGDAQCPAGGIVIRVSQGDGTLGPPQTICSAPGGIVARSTNLAPGDAHCGAGGVKLELSSVPPGSTNFDPNNIISTQYLCNPSSTPVGSLVAPDGPAGTTELLTRGGDGKSSTGGDGGNVSLSMLAGSLGGHVKIWKTGTATATVTMPAAPASLDLGANPLSVTTGITTVAASTTDSCTGLAAGSFYWFVDTAGAAHLRSCAAGVTGAGATVTGISVSAGAQLAFSGVSCPAEPALPPTTCAKVSVAAACVNAGTITVNQGLNPAAPRLVLTCGSFRGQTGSSIALTPGGFAAVNSNGSLHNAGDIDVSQNAGAIDLSAAFGLVSTGKLLAKGAPGGPGGAVRITGGLGGAAVSGQITTSGGDGATGGPAGPVSITVAPGGGSLHSAASIVAVGGVGGAADGGAGGAVSLAGVNGDVVVSGAIVTAGGASQGGAGGAGGAVTI
ncbi:MAG TPA: hypothetical protein VFP65_18180, partial [Anaeromyxobacteraceae bacterium]|nr:hypothetical protein [Anaeromyxobacteraceae bacterium]